MEEGSWSTLVWARGWQERVTTVEMADPYEVPFGTRPSVTILRDLAIREQEAKLEA